MSRQAPFLKSVLNEANAHKRQQRLRYANIDQINAVSELVLNTLRGVVPQGKFTLKRMRPHASALRFIANPRNLAKRRRHTMIHQLGAGNLVGKNYIDVMSVASAYINSLCFLNDMLNQDETATRGHVGSLTADVTGYSSDA